MRTDLHQHLLPDALLGLLARRTEPPALRRDADGWVLRLAGEPDSPVDLADHDPAGRAALAQADGLDRVALSLSGPLGIERLPAEEAEPLLDAFNAGVLALGAPFCAWGAVGLDDPRPEAVDALLDAGAIGVSLPGSALAEAAVAPVLERLEARDAPVFAHPGPAAASPGAAPWWPALTDYVAEMSAAWLAFAVWGRQRHPGLRVLFAILAGGGPLHAERLVARGGPPEAVDDALAYFDVSSYGARALDAMVRVVGADQLVLGSDRPVTTHPVAAGLGPAFEEALAVANPVRLLGLKSGYVPALEGGLKLSAPVADTARTSRPRGGFER